MRAVEHVTRGDEELSVLVVRARDGDEVARSAFVSRTIDDVWRYCAHLLDPSRADDATQATYLRALRSLHAFRGDSSPRTWLLGVARNTCLDERRASARRRRLLDRVAERAATDAGTSDGDLAAVEGDELLARLEPDRREAFVLTQLLGFSYDEAATTLGCPIGTVRSRVARARRDLLAAEAGSDDGHGHLRAAR